jgi:hypothetical protein
MGERLNIRYTLFNGKEHSYTMSNPEKDITEFYNELVEKFSKSYANKTSVVIAGDTRTLSVDMKSVVNYSINIE